MNPLRIQEAVCLWQHGKLHRLLTSVLTPNQRVPAQQERWPLTTPFSSRGSYSQTQLGLNSEHRSPGEVNVSVAQSCDEPKPPTSTPTPNTFLSVKTRSLPVNLGFRTLVLGQTALLAAAGSAQYSGGTRAFPHPLTVSVGTHSHIHCSHFYHNCSTTTRVTE